MEKFILILLIVLNVGTIFAFPGQVFIGNPVIARGDRKIDSIYNFYGSPPSSELNISKFQIFHVKNVTVHEDCDQILQDLSSQTFQGILKTTAIAFQWCFSYSPNVFFFGLYDFFTQNPMIFKNSRKNGFFFFSLSF